MTITQVCDMLGPTGSRSSWDSNASTKNGRGKAVEVGMAKICPGDTEKAIWQELSIGPGL